MDVLPSSPAPGAPPGASGITDAPAPAPGELFCPDCGYDLRAIDSDRCPECGLTIDRDHLGVSRIPWAHRRRIGRVRAYGRTVWLATFQTRRLGDEVARPVDYRDAQRFRLVTVALATLPPVALIAGAVAHAGGFDALTEAMQLAGPGVTALGGAPPPGVYDLTLPWITGALLPPVLPLGILVFNLLLTGVAGYWFHPKSLSVARQNRAVALSHYACAPLALVPLTALGFGAMMYLVANDLAGGARLSTPFLAALLIGYGSLPLIALAFYAVTLRLLRRATHAGARRMLAAAALIPLTWLLSAAAGLFAVPWVVGFVWIVFESFR